MIANLKPYPKMKDSGVPWLGELPEHWKVVRAKNVFRPIDVRSASGEEGLLTVSSERGVVPRAEASVTMFEAESYTGHKLCWPGDLVINSLWAWAGGLAVSDFYGIVSSAYGVYRPSSGNLVPEFANALVRSRPFQWELRVRSKGVWTSRLQITDESFLGAPFPLPPTAEQHAIVRFLHYANRRIDNYIQAKQKLIKLLKEQKQAIIHQAVTRGLDPNVRLKPSSVDWLGDIPEHWQVRRLKWATRLQRGYDLPAEKRTSGPFPVVSSGGLIDWHIESRATAPGVVLGRYGSTDAVYFVERDYWPHNTSLFVTDFQGNDPRWAFYMLRTISKADHAGKSAVPGVDRKDLLDIKIPIPPRNEQSQLVDQIDRASEKIDLAIRRTSQELELVAEFRTKLVAEIVTGQLDVRQHDVDSWEAGSPGESMSSAFSETGGAVA